MATEAVRYTLPRSARLLGARDFRRVYSRGRRAHGKSLVVVALRRRGGGSRLGVSVSKAHGPAVRRNKIKRLLREAFRLERPTLPGDFDLVLIPQPRERYDLTELRAELRELITVIARTPRRVRGGKRGRKTEREG